MKYSFIKLTVATLVVFTFVFISSCVRERDTDTEITSDHSLGEFVYNDAASIADDASTQVTGGTLSNYKTTSACATVTHDVGSTPKKITIDFGSTNCMCSDGRYRRGKIICEYVGSYRDSNSTHTISFDNYYVNDNKILGTKKVTNMGHNALNQLYYNVEVNGTIEKASSGGTITFISNRVRTWVAGESTLVWSDDIYEITGSGSGKNANGINYTMNIVEPLVKEVYGCPYITKGKIEIQPQGKALRKLDFGSGTCDNDATVTINSKTYNIKLK